MGDDMRRDHFDRRCNPVYDTTISPRILECAHRSVACPWSRDGRFETLDVVHYLPPKSARDGSEENKVKIRQGRKWMDGCASVEGDGRLWGGGLGRSHWSHNHFACKWSWYLGPNGLSFPLCPP